MKRLNKLFLLIPIVLMATGLIPIKSEKNIVYAKTYNSTVATAEAETIHVSGYISENTTWTNNYTYVVDGTIIVQQGVKLQIDQGVIVKFTQGTEIIVNGTLSVSGTESDKVVFTGINDLTYGGSGVTGSYDYWLGITVSAAGEFTGDNVKIRYAGADSNYSNSAINVQGKLNLTNSEVSNSKNNGIYMNTTVDVSIKNNNIISNQRFGIYINNISADANNTMVIENNTISGNSGCGVYVSQAGTGNALLEGNMIANNGGSGIYIDIFGTGNLSVRNNNLLNNTESGIYVSLGGLSSSIFTGIADNTYEGNTIKGEPCNGVGIGGNTPVDITLSNGVYYLADFVLVPNDKTLTVQPGTIIKSSSKGSSIYVYGKLNAMGTEGSSIVFTSYKDATYGGSGVTGSYDYWLGITVSATGEFAGDNVKIRYAGVDSNYSNCAINVQGKLNLTNSEVSSSKNCGIYLNTNFDAEVKNNNIISNQGIGIYINNLSADATNTMDIENNTISGNNGCGVYLSQAGTGNSLIERNLIANNGGSGIYIDIFGIGTLSVRNNNLLNNMDSGILVYLGGLSSSIFTGIADNTYEGNTTKGVSCNGVGIGGSTTVDITLSNGVYCLADFVMVPNGRTLTIQPGTIIKSSSKSSSIYVCGKLNAMGLEGSPIVFTSHKDASFGGSGVTGYYDYWSGITVADTGEFNGENIKIRYAGSDYSRYSPHCAINVEGKLNLTNSKVSNSYEYSILFNTNIHPVLSGNTFAENPSGMYNIKASIMTINAQNNYWNSSSGPSVYDNTKGEWIGEGDRVNDGISCFPWLTGI